MSMINDIKQEREGEIAQISIDTALAINKSAAELSALIEARKATSWWRFLKRRRLKRSIAIAAAVQAMTAVLGGAQIATVISTPIPKYPNGL